MSCNCNNNYSQGIYGNNMWYINGNNPGINNSCYTPHACGECLEIIKDTCTAYTGVNLPGTGINQNDTLRVIITKLDAIKVINDAKFAKILLNLNDINTRLNTLAGGTPHDPYNLS